MRGRFLAAALVLLGAVAALTLLVARIGRPVVVPAQGIPLTLAEDRAARVSELEYALFLSVPADRAAPINGSITATFALKDAAKGISFDFAAPPERLLQASVNDVAVSLRVESDHINIPGRLLEDGINKVEFSFIAGDAPLNRNDDFLYALFVPARASQAVPVFDQPDLKARWLLVLGVPPEWQAVSNGVERGRRTINNRLYIGFEETQPISTYLFTFAAGKFQIEEAQRGGRTMRMLHRETNAGAVARNKDAIFDLHASALAWLEDYTAIPYPFGKFDFVLIPSFQFGGMEHPGSVFYNASSLFLDESATQNQLLGRASLIAHETAHMWFGDLVTMKWFNDVWMKEVFANFMAAKIVNPSFPEVNHDLRFLFAHYPAAYDVDRTPGANPIRQELANLNEAGSLYGAIIYQKAPIVMRELERLIGAGAMRDGLREYLKNHAFGNATWNDLIRILDARTDQDLQQWSREWVETAGRPRVTGASSFTYGDVVLDGPAIEQLSSSLHTIADPLTRGESVVLLWENMQEGRVAPRDVMRSLLSALEVEREELIVNQMLAYLRELFWRFTPHEEREHLAPRVEALLRRRMQQADTPARKASWFNALRSVATTTGTLAFLEDAWRTGHAEGLPLAEADQTELALDLAVREVAASEEILTTQADRIRNTDRKARFAFVRPALSRDPAVRAAFFDSLRDVSNRRREAWVLDAMRYLHHPVRRETSRPHLRPSLELVREIQRTGDIFFPKRWADAALSGYQSPEAAAEVQAFIDGLPARYPQRLRWVLLASADPLFRASKMR